MFCTEEIRNKARAFLKMAIQWKTKNLADRLFDPIPHFCLIFPVIQKTGCHRLHLIRSSQRILITSKCLCGKCVTCSAVWVLAASNEWLAAVWPLFKCCLCLQGLDHSWCARCVNSVPAPAHRGPTFRRAVLSIIGLGSYSPHSGALSWCLC